LGVNCTPRSSQAAFYSIHHKIAKTDVFFANDRRKSKPWRRAMILFRATISDEVVGQQEEWRIPRSEGGGYADVFTNGRGTKPPYMASPDTYVFPFPRDQSLPVVVIYLSIQRGRHYHR
jgi:hypothetical protein